MAEKLILNLVDLDKSDIQYKISKFPDGQQSIELTTSFTRDLAEVTVEIKSRLNSFKDLEVIICANQAVRNLECRNVQLYVPYLLGARSDRAFTFHGVNYLKQVICPIINSQNFTRVRVLDPHSDVLEACINNFKKVPNIELVRWALTNIDNKNEAQSRVMLMSPDAGALKKIYDVAKEFRIQNVTTASKVRDIKTGNILRTELPTMNLDGIEHIVIIDDICDGGRTFIELAKEIRKQTDKSIYLIVTHGIFSGGLYDLSKHINSIYCTNSVKNIEVESYSDYTVNKDYLKQQNVF